MGPWGYHSIVLCEPKRVAFSQARRLYYSRFCDPLLFRSASRSLASSVPPRSPLRPLPSLSPPPRIHRFVLDGSCLSLTHTKTGGAELARIAVGLSSMCW